MYTYADLKKQEKELKEKINIINLENINILSKLDEFKVKYPKEFNVITVDLHSVDIDRIIYRLIVLQDDINMSKQIPEEVKKHIISIINEIGQKSQTKVEECSKLKEKLEENKTNLENRKKYVLEKVNKIKENKNRQLELDDKKNFYEKLMNHKYCEPQIKVESERIIENIKNENNMIQNEIDKIVKEPDLKEDYNLINNGMPMEIEELKLEEKKEDEITIIENKPDNLIPEIENLKVIDSPKKEEQPIQESSNIPDLEAVKPEEPLKVILKKKASPELINKIKNGGKTALGILIIGAAVAAVIANPMALLAIPAGGLLYDQAKEHILKK